MKKINKMTCYDPPEFYLSTGNKPERKYGTRKERALEARITAGSNIILYSPHFLDGKDYRLSLGEEARRKAEEYRVSFRKGIDPRDLERKPRDSIKYVDSYGASESKTKLIQ
jgi:hypothetical protein